MNKLELLTKKTDGRLRAKFDNKIEELELPIGILGIDNSQPFGWVFVSKLKNVPASIAERFSMVYFD